MKKIALMICVLIAFSIGMVHSQTSFGPVAGTTSEYEFNNGVVQGSILPIAIPAELPAAALTVDKISMVASPNPFTARTTINCILPAKGKLTLGIRNMFGESVKTLEENILQEGSHLIEVTSEHLRPGIYTAMLVFRTNDDVVIKTIRIVFNQ